MTRRTLVLLVLAGVLLVLALAFVLFVPHTSRVEPASLLATSSPPAVLLHDAYRKGTHTLSGSFALKNPCTTFAAAVSATGTPPAITVALSVGDDEGICLQEPATTTFSLSVKAPQGAAVSATVNGVPATVVSK